MIALLCLFGASLKVQINGYSPIVSNDIVSAVMNSNLKNEEILNIHILEGELDPVTIATSYKDLQTLTMEGTAYVKKGEIPDKCFLNSFLLEVKLTGVTRIGNEAFSKSRRLVKFIAPSITSIGEKAFQDCEVLQEFVFPSGVSVLPKSVLHGCNSITYLSIEGPIKKVPEYFFSGLAKLRFVSIPSSAENFESPFVSSVNVTLIRPLDYCPDTEDVIIPRVATQIGPNLFNGCKKIKRVFVHDKIETIGRSAFANMPDLYNVTFKEPSKLFMINDFAFSNCSSLEYITLPESLRANGKLVFSHSKKLKTVYIHSSYDMEWFGEGIIGLTRAKIEEIVDEFHFEELHGFPKFTPCPTRPPQKPLTYEEKEKYKPKPSNKRENVVFFFSDQQRWDTIGPNGQKLDVTPNIDQLAREGVNFARCYTNQPVCGPVRAIIQSGIYPTNMGIFKNAIPLPVNQPNLLATEMKKLGYSTAYIGKWHLASDKDQQHYETIPVPLKYRGGWDEYWCAADVIEFTSHGYGGYVYDQDMNKREFTGYRVDCVTDFALEFIRNYDDEKPFVLFLSHLEPHHQNDHGCFEGPVGSKEKFRDFEKPADLTKGEGDWEKFMPDYLGCCNALDKNLGRVVEALKEKGIYDDTMIIYTSDHGCHFRSHPEEIEPGGVDDYKCSSFESALRIPLVVKGRDFYGGEVCTRLVSSITFPCTLVRAAGGVQPSTWVGRPLQEWKSDDWEDVLYSQVSQSSIGRLVRTNRWKYVIHVTGKDPMMNGGNDKDTWTDKHLFDEINDPTEKHDLVNDPSYKDIKLKLRELIKQKAYWAGEGNFTIVDTEDIKASPNEL